jgi:hypothetical protein
MSYKIVVARFNENVDWLDEIKQDCILYNKGPEYPIEKNYFQYHELPNVGRESDTYFNYIISNYENLPEVVIFTQANISDHRGKNDIQYLMKLKTEAFEHGKSLPITVYYKRNERIWNDSFYPEWNYNREGNFEYHKPDTYKNNQHIIFCDWFVKTIQPEYPNPLEAWNCAIFAVKKELILKHDKAYYQKLLEECNHHNDPIEGHFLERSWYYIFQ